jgi:gamma-glutamyl phosphate reductase
MDGNMDSTTCGERAEEHLGANDLLSMVRAYSDRIQNGRTLYQILLHLEDEVNELNQELVAEEPGDDGIAGEAVDVMLCALDMIFEARPDWTDADIVAYAERKCRKWANKNHK